MYDIYFLLRKTITIKLNKTFFKKIGENANNLKQYFTYCFYA